MYTQEKAWGIRLVVKAIDSRYVCSCTCIYIYAVHGNVGSTGPWNYESIQCPVKLSSTCPYKKNQWGVSMVWLLYCCCACSYTEVRRRISDKYAEIENQLINEFIDAQMTLDTKRMKMYARALVPFSYVSWPIDTWTKFTWKLKWLIFHGRSQCSPQT